MIKRWQCKPRTISHREDKNTAKIPSLPWKGKCNKHKRCWFSHSLRMENWKPALSLLLKNNKKNCFSITLSFYFPPVHRAELCNTCASPTMLKNHQGQFLISITKLQLHCHPAACWDFGRGLGFFSEFEPQISLILNKAQSRGKKEAYKPWRNLSEVILGKGFPEIGKTNIVFNPTRKPLVSNSR